MFKTLYKIASNNICHKNMLKSHTSGTLYFVRERIGDTIDLGKIRICTNVRILNLKQKIHNYWDFICHLFLKSSGVEIIVGPKR